MINKGIGWIFIVNKTVDNEPWQQTEYQTMLKQKAYYIGASIFR